MPHITIHTVRIAARVASRAEFIARTDEISMAEVVRQASPHRARSRRSDVAFVDQTRSLTMRDAGPVGGLR